ncbi:hypothetical protein SD80_019910 [Scytonema tolypothrichoides VB-61278]|nr:hypothetical protein SD80_019910 [Scytonema tolypothrichoides VB-61278]
MSYNTVCLVYASIVSVSHWLVDVPRQKVNPRVGLQLAFNSQKAYCLGFSLISNGSFILGNAYYLEIRQKKLKIIY